jgi:hypothetical protein
MTTLRIQELESLGFEWNSHGAAWEDHFNDLADYHIIQGHCNVPHHGIEKRQAGCVGRSPKVSIQVVPKKERVCR